MRLLQNRGKTTINIFVPTEALGRTPLIGERTQATLRGRPRGRLGPGESVTTFLRDRLDRLGSTQGAGAI